MIIIKHYTNLDYFNVSVRQCERHLSNLIDYCKYYHLGNTISIGLSFFVFVLFTHRLILMISYTNILIYAFVCKIALLYLTYHQSVKHHNMIL